MSTTPDTSKLEEKYLEDQVLIYLKAKDAYYNGQPIMDDLAFDTIEEFLKTYAPHHPCLQQVGHKTRSESNVTHVTPMLSTDKALTDEALAAWFDSRKKELGVTGLAATATAKLDGMSCELRYEDGNLVLAASRGDGEQGADITAKLRYVVPNFTSYEFTGRVRGEIVLPRELFTQLNQILATPLANTRNGVVGIINEETIDTIKLSHVRFIAYEVFKDGPYKFETYTHQLQYLVGLGFQTPRWLLTGTSPGETPRDITEGFKMMREVASEDWDGVVFRVTNTSLAEQLGRTSKFWKHSIAWKFPPEARDVLVTGIEWSVGTRELTPVVTFEPTTLDGAVCQRASGKSPRNLAEIGALPGSYVRLVRSGGVIPWIQRSPLNAESSSTALARVMSFAPTNCPSCQARLQVSDDFAHITCTSQTCSGSLARQLEILAKAMDIKFMGPAVCKTLVEAGYIQDLKDLPTLATQLDEFEEAAMAQDIGEGTLVRIREEVSSAMQREHAPWDILGSVGIQRLAVDSAKKLILLTGSIEEAMQAGPTELNKALGITSDALQQTITQDIQNKRVQIQELLNQGIKLKKVNKPKENSQVLGKVFVVTGALDGLSRDEFKNKLEQLGAKLGSSVSKNTDYLVTNDSDPTSSKARAAKAHGVLVISQREAMDILNRA